MDIDWDTQLLSPVMSVFGTSVTYMPASGTPFDMSGVFDESYLRVQLGDSGIPASTESPVLGVRVSQFPSGKPPRKGDLVLVKKVNMVFEVKEQPHFDGHGHAKLMLIEKCAGPS